MAPPSSHFGLDRSEWGVLVASTNVGAYLWSTLVAERLGLIGHAETVARLGTTIGTLERMERFQPGGQFYNWYDHHTGRS